MSDLSPLSSPSVPHILSLTHVSDNRSAAVFFADKKARTEYVSKVFRLVENSISKPVVQEEYPLSTAGVHEAEKEVWESKMAGKCDQSSSRLHASTHLAETQYRFSICMDGDTRRSRYATSDMRMNARTWFYLVEI